MFSISSVMKLPDVLDELNWLSEVSEEQGMGVRLVGGLAVQAYILASSGIKSKESQDVIKRVLLRNTNDIDLDFYNLQGDTSNLESRVLESFLSFGELINSTFHKEETTKSVDGVRIHYGTFLSNNPRSKRELRFDYAIKTEKPEGNVLSVPYFKSKKQGKPCLIPVFTAPLSEILKDKLRRMEHRDIEDIRLLNKLYEVGRLNKYLINDVKARELFNSYSHNEIRINV